MAPSEIEQLLAITSVVEDRAGVVRARRDSLKVLRTLRSRIKKLGIQRGAEDPS